MLFLFSFLHDDVLHGVIHGRTIELAEDPQLPDGQNVSLKLLADGESPDLEGLRKAFGSWSDMPGYDEWLDETYRSRLVDRAGSNGS